VWCGVNKTMRLLFAIKLCALVCIIAAAAKFASACQCGSSIHGKSALELAKLQAEGATVIFEGTPERFELQWSVLRSKVGELIPAESPDERRDRGPRMLVTFRVGRAYKGSLEPKVQISTGLGGGDCGARFAPGVTYLVYAFGPSLHELGVSMCSPGGWIGGNNVAADLRYLRNERPTASDLVAPKPLWAYPPAEQEKRIQVNREEIKRRYAAITGSICGTVVGQNGSDELGSVSFLFTDGYSPVDHPTAQVNRDGSFCSERLGPGAYNLYFTRRSDKGLSSALYYPGVEERAKATPIQVNAGRDESGFIFNVSTRTLKTYSVRGLISTNDKSGLSANDVSIALISLDGDRQTWYQRTIDFEGFFPFPKIKYFNFENVVPGRYIAYASVSGQGWFTKTVEVTVSTRAKFISLELVHRK
jgi:hypothetical protein